MSASPLAPEWLAFPDDANALDPGIWPATAARDAAGALTIGGVSAARLVAEHGSPLYVVDEHDARARALRVKAAFDAAFKRVGTGATVYYAGKALLTTEVARWMLAAGLNIDVCTGGEFAVAVAAGADPARLGFHGNNKGLGEIETTVAAGIGVIVLDSEQEIDRVADAALRQGRLQKVRLRVNTGVHAHTHEYLATAREDQKFGLPLADVPRVVAAIRARAELEFIGLHAHIGSQIFADGGFVESARRLMALYAELGRVAPVPELNLGGGFGIAYTSADEPIPIEEHAAGLADAVAAAAAAHGIPVPHVAVEPGRIIIGPAGLTLYTVGTTKAVEVTDDGAVATRLYASVDGGMSDNVRTALYHADYTVRLADRVSTAEPVLIRLAGKHCESGDLVVRDDYLPGDVAPDDLVAVPATGAYCWSLSSNYNWVGRAPLVAVADGASRVLVRGMTPDDLLQFDTGAGAHAAEGVHA